MKYNVEFNSRVCEGGKCKRANGCWSVVLHHIRGQGWREGECLWSKDLWATLDEYPGGASGVQACWWCFFFSWFCQKHFLELTVKSTSIIIWIQMYFKSFFYDSLLLIL